jgi:hypothetical protein
MSLSCIVMFNEHSLNRKTTFFSFSEQIMLAKRLFKRNLDWANSLRYDLNQVHSPKVVEMLHATADQLLLDAQILSVGIRALAAYHEDLGSVFVANERQRSRSIVEFNLLIGNVGQYC